MKAEPPVEQYRAVRQRVLKAACVYCMHMVDKVDKAGFCRSCTRELGAEKPQLMREMTRY